jgi:formyltetrahydrofolate hydrolase
LVSNWSSDWNGSPAVFAVNFVTVCHQPVVNIAVRRAAVDHAYSPEQLFSSGCSVECLALGSARHYALEHRVFISSRAVVLRQDLMSTLF